MYRIILISYCLLFTGSGLIAQDIFYFGANSKPVDTKEEAVLYKEVEQRSANRYVVMTWYRSENHWERQSKSRIRKSGNSWTIWERIPEKWIPMKTTRETEKVGPNQISFSETGKDNSTRSGTSSRYLPLHLEGEIQEFYPNGNLKSISVYNNNQLVSNRNWLPDGTKYIDSVFYSADNEPLFNPGSEFFSAYVLQQLKNSKIDMNQIDDLVVIGWVVMETGDKEGVIALEGRSRLFNNLLVEIISGMPGGWEPARLNGRPVRYFMTIPLNFSHEEYSFQEVEFSSGMLHYNQY